MLAGLSPDGEQHLLRRWRFVLSDAGLQLRGADREHTSARVVVEALGADPTTAEGAADVVVVLACLRASTAALLRWAAADGHQPLAALIDEAFAALRSM
jgi:hypothetical protein